MRHTRGLLVTERSEAAVGAGLASPCAQALRNDERRQLPSSRQIRQDVIVHVRRVSGVGQVVIEAGVIAGYVIAWVARKARRAAGRLDAEVDEVIDAGLDRLHEVVAARLGADPVLEDLRDEADQAAGGDGRVSELTRQRVELAIMAAGRKDDSFGQVVTDLVTQIREAERTAGGSLVAGAGSAVFTGAANARADNGGIAFGQVGGDVKVVRVDDPLADPPGPGRPGH